jgi:hypothetical protein
MSNIKHRVSLLEENIALKQDNKELSEKFDIFAFEMKQCIDQLLSEMRDIKQSGAIALQKENINTGLKDSYSEIKETNPDPAPFIPSSNVEDMRVNVNDVEKKHRSSNVSDAASKLLKLQQESI